MTVPSFGGVVDLGALAPSKPSAPIPPAPEGAIIDVTDATFGSVVELSRTVPVVVDLWATWCQPCRSLSPILERLTAEYGGRLVLAKVDVDANPQVASAFQVQSIPTVVAIIAGKMLPLFQGAYPEAQVRQIFEQLLQVAAEQGVTGTLGQEGEAEPAEPELPPHHAAGLAAIEAGDLETAESEYRAAIKENPGDAEAKAALAQVVWMRRVAGEDHEATIAQARLGDLESQLRAADAEMATGRMAAAFARLLGLVREGGDFREPARQRLVEYFEIIGPGVPEVAAARRDLASALY